MLLSPHHWRWESASIVQRIEPGVNSLAFFHPARGEPSAACDHRCRLGLSMAPLFGLGVPR
jgi:hypothetical protein